MATEHLKCATYNGETEFEILFHFNYLKLKLIHMASGQHGSRMKFSQ
jgi:hypothetical protein